MAFLLALGSPPGAYAQAAISECEALGEPAIAAQRERCAAHAACNFVLTHKPDCDKAKDFLKRMQGNALERITGLFSPRKPVTTNDVYEANLPAVDYPEDWKEQFAAVRANAIGAGNETASGKLGDGEAWHYQGDMREGKRAGWGFMFWSKGDMFRGQFSDNQRDGTGEYAALNGYREVGAYKSNALVEGRRRLRDAALQRGHFVAGELEGVGSMVYSSGASHSGNYRNSLRHGRGIYRWPDGSSFEGNFTDGKLDGQGSYTSPSGERSARTYAAGNIVADSSTDATPASAAAPVNPIASCNRNHETCSTACTAAGLIGTLLSRGQGDNSGTQRCLEHCAGTQEQCLANTEPAPGAPGVAAATTPATSGAVPSGATIGAAGVAVLDGLGVPSRFSCMKLEWISEAVRWGNHVAQAYLGLSRAPSPDDDRYTQRKLLVATSECEADVIFFVVGCQDETMVTAGGGGPKSQYKPWVRGELAGTKAYLATNTIMKRGQRLSIAESYVWNASDSANNFSKTITPIYVGLGAWTAASLSLASGNGGLSEGGERLRRRTTALNLELNRALRGKADLVRLGAMGGNTPPIFRANNPDGGSCRTANIQGVWERTQ